MKRFLIVLSLMLISFTALATEMSVTPKDADPDTVTCVAKIEQSVSNSMCATAPAHATYCCKVCSVGKACGNSCISRDKDCHQPPGCACDG